MSNRIDELREWYIENKDNIKNGNTDRYKEKEIGKIRREYLSGKKGALQKLHKKEYDTIPWDEFYKSTKNLLWSIFNIDGECKNIHNKKNKNVEEKNVEEKIDDYIVKIAKLIHEEKWEDVELSLSNVEKEIVKNIEVKELFYKILMKYIGWHLTVLNRKYNIKYEEKKTNTKDIIDKNEELKEVIQALLLYECIKKEGLQKGLQCATNVKDGVIQTIKRKNNKKVDSKTFSDFVNQLLKLLKLTKSKINKNFLVDILIQYVNLKGYEMENENLYDEIISNIPDNLKELGEKIIEEMKKIKEIYNVILYKDKCISEVER